MVGLQHLRFVDGDLARGPEAPIDEFAVTEELQFCRSWAVVAQFAVDARALGGADRPEVLAGRRLPGGSRAGAEAEGVLILRGRTHLASGTLLGMAEDILIDVPLSSEQIDAIVTRVIERLTEDGTPTTHRFARALADRVNRRLVDDVRFNRAPGAQLKPALDGISSRRTPPMSAGS